jgi:hypothetical protein
LFSCGTTCAKQRHHFPEETRLWAFRRTPLGDNAVYPNADELRIFHTPELPQPKSSAQESTPREYIVHEEAQDVNSISYEDYDEGSIGRHAPKPADGAQNHFVLAQPSILESSLILSIEEESHDTNCNDERWSDQQRLALLEPMQRSRQRNSCQWGSSLETISELSQLSFVEEAADGNQWDSGAKPFASGSRMPLTIPERPESSNEDVITDYGDNVLREPPGPPKIGGVDSPISIPCRKLSPQPGSLLTNPVDEDKHRTWNTTSPMNKRMGCHIRVPQRKLSPVVASQ